MENRILVDTNFSQIEIVDNYLIVTVNEGHNLGEKELSNIQEIANIHIKGEMGYISHHLHDYSISPVDVVNFILNNKRLNHIAYVSTEGDHKSRLMVLLRLIPSSVKFRTFKTMEAAIYWMEESLNPANELSNLDTY